MKFALSILLVAFVSLSGSAQIVSKSRLIGLNLGLQSQYAPNAAINYSSSSFNFQPSFGKFLNEKWLFSMGPEYFYTTSTSAQYYSSSRLSTHTIGLNAGMTRFVPIFEKLYFTLGGNLYSRLSFSQNKITAFDGTTTFYRDNANNSGLIILPGFAYYLNQRWIITAGFGQLSYDLLINDNSTIHRLNFNLSTSSLGFGFRYVLGAKN